MKVVFKCYLSGNVFYKKGDEVLLEDSEALRLLEKGIVEIKEQEQEIKDQKKPKNAKKIKKAKNEIKGIKRKRKRTHRY